MACVQKPKLAVALAALCRFPKVRCHITTSISIGGPNGIRRRQDLKEGRTIIESIGGKAGMQMFDDLEVSTPT